MKSSSDLGTDSVLIKVISGGKQPVSKEEKYISSQTCSVDMLHLVSLQVGHTSIKELPLALLSYKIYKCLTLNISYRCIDHRESKLIMLSNSWWDTVHNISPDVWVFLEYASFKVSWYKLNFSPCSFSAELFPKQTLFFSFPNMRDAFFILVVVIFCIKTTWRQLDSCGLETHLDVVIWIHLTWLVFKAEQQVFHRHKVNLVRRSHQSSVKQFKIRISVQLKLCCYKVTKLLYLNFEAGKRKKWGKRGYCNYYFSLIVWL